jgi:large subunit ribosomal protein L10
VKNTLTRRAAGVAGLEGLDELLTGPTAIAFVTDGDPVAVAKTLSDTARETHRLSLKGGVLEGRSIGADAVEDLAALPPLDVLRGQVLGAIVAPLTSMLGLVGASLQGLVGLVDARVDQLGPAGDEPRAEEARAEEPQAEEAQAEEPQAEAPPAGDEPAEEPEARTDETITEEEQ